MNGRGKPIGIFDSGMGGLTVLRALQSRLPGERYLYLGDTARLPYGTKSPDTVRRYAIQASHELLERDVKLVVIACNTASVALAALQEALAPVPVVGWPLVEICPVLVLSRSDAVTTVVPLLF